MKLRNKKTGGLASILADEQDFIRVYTDAGWHDYDSVAEMMEEWEDYKPTEPLIKDEKIRKAVRAWAEINGIDKVRYTPYGSNEYTLIYDVKGVNLWIQFEKSIGELVEDQFYSITELCWEEEE